MEDDSIQQAFNFRKSRNFKAALAIYDPLWQQNPQHFDDWSGWSYSFCLKETGQFEKALKVCRQLYPRYKQSQIIGNLYAQCIYYTQFKADPLPPVTTLKNAAKAMVDLSPPHQKYSLTSRAIFLLGKTMMKQNPIAWQEIETWLHIMDPDLLDSSPFTINQPNGKTTEYASQQEEWYSQMIRVKGGQNQPQEMIRLLDEARKRNIQWHYQNDIWMKRKRAFAYKELNQPEKAVQLLQEILKRKNDWFLHADLGDALTDKNESLKAYCTAAIEPGKMEMKINVFEKIAKMIQPTYKFQAEYRQHLLLIARIRMESGWPVLNELESALQQENIDIGSVKNVREVFHELLPFWRKISGNVQNLQKGQIKVIHENGKSGMITGKNGTSYFFSMNEFKGKPVDLKPGTKIEFELKNGYNKKREQAVVNACRIRVSKKNNHEHHS